MLSTACSPWTGGSDSMFNSQPRTNQTPNTFSRYSRPQDTESYQLTRNLLSERLRKKASSSLEKMRAAAADLERLTRAQDLGRYQSRQWKEGDVYSPHDLSPIEMAKWRVKQRRQIDAFDVLAINPINEYKVSILLRK